MCVGHHISGILRATSSPRKNAAQTQSNFVRRYYDVSTRVLSEWRAAKSFLCSLPVRKLLTLYYFSVKLCFVLPFHFGSPLPEQQLCDVSSRSDAGEGSDVGWQGDRRLSGRKSVIGKGWKRWQNWQWSWQKWRVRWSTAVHEGTRRTLSRRTWLPLRNAMGVSESIASNASIFGQFGVKHDTCAGAWRHSRGAMDRDQLEFMDVGICVDMLFVCCGKKFEYCRIPYAFLGDVNGLEFASGVFFLLWVV